MNRNDGMSATHRKLELLAPGGDVDSIKAAISAGADAVYCGINKFNARNRATNVTFDDLNGILRLAHKNACEVFLTINIIIIENEIPDLIRLLNKLINTSIDGVIIQDLGLAFLLSKYFKGLKIHASTQLTTHNEGQIKFLTELNATRVNLSRELNLEEIRNLSTSAHQNKILVEVFVHGSYCVSFSGLCYMSSVQSGNSGNRGRCSQPCRDQYITTPAGSQYPLNLKDNSAWSDLKELSEAGVDSIKIEGRIKKFHYVHTVVSSYREQLQRLYKGENLLPDSENLQKTFNRSFSNGFLKGEITRDMFIDNPRDQSATGQAEFANIKSIVQNSIDKLSVEKTALKIEVSGKVGAPLKVEIVSPDSSQAFNSHSILSDKGVWSINEKELLKRFKAINDTAYFIEELNLTKLEPNLHIPFKELTKLKSQILFFLRDSKEQVDPITLPVLNKTEDRKTPPALLVLISSEEDTYLCKSPEAEIFFQVPDSISDRMSEFAGIFRKNKNITPWFPSILIGNDFSSALRLLQEIKPNRIVTDNTGIAFEANKLGIPWIAGPRMNLVNSYSLLCMKENFNCSGAFISNELNKQQINRIKKPENFDLYYSIYHPIEVMISRQCFFHQVTGCRKKLMDQDCLPKCQKSASIKNTKGNTFFIVKKHGNYNRIYSESNFLNTSIVTEMNKLFAGFLIDMTDIKTNTKMATNKEKTIELFANHLKGGINSTEQLHEIISPTSHSQYIVGI